ncbi:MAG: GTP-binding protein [Thermomicrobiales bacterium]
MALIDLTAREIQGKIVYFGPGLGGKTTNLLYVYRRLPDERRGELVSLATDEGRTIFFDLMPLDLGTVLGYRIRFRLYTVAGQEHYERARGAILSGADGVVFVADAQRSRLDDNLTSLRELSNLIAAQGKRLEEMPLVLQYNKMDLPTALPVDVLDQHLNPGRAARFEAVAVRGAGVFDTLRAICKLTAANL